MRWYWSTGYDCGLYDNFDEVYVNFFATIKENANKLGILDIFKDKLELQYLYDEDDFLASEDTSVKEKIDNLERFVFSDIISSPFLIFNKLFAYLL